jgi:hypothetical protein
LAQGNGQRTIASEVTEKRDVSLFHLSDRKSRIGLLPSFLLIVLSLVKIAYLGIFALQICVYLLPTLIRQVIDHTQVFHEICYFWSISGERHLPDCQKSKD